MDVRKLFDIAAAVGLASEAAEFIGKVSAIERAPDLSCSAQKDSPPGSGRRLANASYRSAVVW